VGTKDKGGGKAAKKAAQSSLKDKRKAKKQKAATVSHSVTDTK
jgi:hypothetical protein